MDFVFISLYIIFFFTIFVLIPFGISSILKNILKKFIHNKILLQIITAFSFIILSGVILSIFFIPSYYHHPDYEKSKEAEPKMLLTEILKCQNKYKEQHGQYADSIEKLYGYCNSVAPIPSSCRQAYYFYYLVNNTKAQAIRCTKGGKEPNATKERILAIDYTSGKIDYLKQ